MEFLGVNVDVPSVDLYKEDFTLENTKMKSEKVGKVKGQKERTEQDEQLMLCHWLRLEYPEVMFWSDMSGVKLPIGLAVKVSQMRSNRAIPDLFIAYPASGKYGLFIELKRTGTRIKKKDGTWASEHVQEQAHVLGELRRLGYGAGFAVGLEEAKKIIALYMGK